MHANGRQPSARQRVPDGAALHYERHRPEQTTLYRLVQQHAASFIAHTEASHGAELPRFIKDEFDAFLECGILAHGFLRVRCAECGHDKLLASSCKRRGFCKTEDVDPIAASAIALGAKCLWQQLGVNNLPAAAAARAAGLASVKDRCVKIEYARLLGGLHWAGVNTGVVSARRRA